MNQDLWSFVDLYPTMCDVAGVKQPIQLEGTSLLPLLKSPEAKNERVWGFPLGKRFHFYTGSVFLYGMEGQRRTELIDRMLFDHSEDEDENYNVAGENENKEIIEALSIKLLENRGANYEK